MKHFVKPQSSIARNLFRKTVFELKKILIKLIFTLKSDGRELFEMCVPIVSKGIEEKRNFIRKDVALMSCTHRNAHKKETGCLFLIGVRSDSPIGWIVL